VRAQKTDDTVVLIYTSGTTGEPKGVMLSNANFISQVKVVPLFKFNESDVWLNHIPLCHSFGLSGDLLAAGEIGGVLALAPSVEPDELRWALRSVRPTVLMSVPRLYEKMFLKIQSTLDEKPPIARKIFGWAHGVGREMFRYTSRSQRPPLLLQAKFRLANRVLHRVRKEAGFDRLRVAYAGGASSAPQLIEFFEGLGLELYQGYGLTETSPVVAVNRPGKNKLGSVGPAIEGAAIRIADDGEILIKGPMVMKGYWNKPTETAEAISPDGWFHTGDIGHLDEDGYLFITDRKKELIVTSGGKNIAPTHLENLFNIDPFVEAAVVVGNDRKFLSALLCPNFEELEKWAAKQGLPAQSPAELARRPEVYALLQKSVDAVNAQLARFETIKKFAVMDHVFCEATGELTATQKYKRRIIDQKYKDVIEGFYRE
jgi:long-chain acyl-CoA synthetase